MKHVSFKHSMATAYSNFAAIHELKNDDGQILLSTDNNLILVTAFGIIEGQPLNPDKTDPNGTLFNSYNKEIVDEFAKNTELEPNNAYILLTNVKILTSTNTQPFEMPYLNVFLDDIIGVTVGKTTIRD